MRAGCAAGILILSLSATTCGGSTTPSSPTPVELSPVAASIVVSGTVREDQQNAGLSGVEVQIATGADAGRTTTTDASGNYSLGGLKLGLFTVRFSRPGFEILERTLSASTDTRLDVQLRRGPSCVALPAPTRLRATVVGNRVNFAWDPVAGATGYIVIRIGEAENSTVILTQNTPQTTFAWRNAPPGTYRGRVGARSSECPHVNWSNDVTFTVAPPAPPS